MVKQYIGGWRSGLALATLAAAIVTMMNIIFLIVAACLTDVAKNGERELYHGNCKSAKDYNVWAHLVINILATAMLGASNYTQQVLSGPTRHEIDRAHAQQKTLDIAVLSIRNLTEISTKRVTAWFMLALSSIPIHLLYNSVVSFEASANYYFAYVSTVDILSRPGHELYGSWYEFERLENKECIATYGQKLVADQSDVILMVNPAVVGFDKNFTVLYESGDPAFVHLPPYDWICRGEFDRIGERNSHLCDPSSIDPENWIVLPEAIFQSPPPYASNDTWRVDYCMSKRSSQQCKLVLNTYILGLVIGCNLIKLFGLAVTWVCLKQRPILTLGDAMGSFLQEPDTTTTDRGLMSRSRGRPVSWDIGPRVWQTRTRRWASAASLRRYGITVSLCAVALCIAIALLSHGLRHIAHIGASIGLPNLWRRGFGEVSMDAIIDFYAEWRLKGPVTMVLIANLPQLIISFLYLALNGIWTVMLVEVEWNSYGTTRKSLRTSYPIGQQRRTYWLSLPLRFSVPLILGSVALHWLTSQSIFLVRLVTYRNGEVWHEGDGPGELITCGHSPIALIFTIALGSIILLTTIGMSLRSMKPTMPAGGTCSAVVSAACHPPEKDESAATKLVQWGVIPGSDRVCLTSELVAAPVAGRFYQ